MVETPSASQGISKYVFTVNFFYFFFSFFPVCHHLQLSLVSAASFGSRCSNQVFTATGRFRGVVVRIKELKFARKKDISRDIMKEMRLLRELRHDNINSFIGACVEPMRTLLVTDYCAKGSLYDIIENEDIKLDDLFIASLIHDLIKVSIEPISPLIHLINPSKHAIHQSIIDRNVDITIHHSPQRTVLLMTEPTFE